MLKLRDYHPLTLQISPDWHMLLDNQSIDSYQFNTLYNQQASTAVGHQNSGGMHQQKTLLTGKL